MPSPSLTLLRTQSDERLVALARAGHERAFEAIVERYRKALLRAARRVLPEGRAEDALQQGLLKAWTALQRGDEVRELRPWLYRIVRHTALNALRMSGYDYDELHEAAKLAGGAGDEELERRAVVRQTLASLAALPERQREALMRTAVSGEPQDAVARDLGLTDNALRQLIHRARVSVRAAATALTPLPLVTAAASGAPRGGLVERVAELAATAAGGSASVTLAKAGTAVVLAGGAISGPAIVDRVSDRPPRTADAAAIPTPASQRARSSSTPEEAEPLRATPVSPARPAKADAAGPARVKRRGAQRRGSHGDDRGARRRHRSGSGDDDALRPDERRAAARPESDDEDRSGSREPEPGDDRDTEGSPEPSSAPEIDDASSGHGSGDDLEQSSSSGPGSGPLPLSTPAPSPEPDGDHGGGGEEPDHD